MSLGIYKEFDNSFFAVRLKGKDGVAKYSEDVISLTFTEEVNKLSQGTIEFYDPNHYYSAIFNDNSAIEIDFGYKKWDASLTQSKNVYVRKSIKALVQNPGGQGGSDGNITFNCQFIATSTTGKKWEKKSTKTFSSGTQQDMVSSIIQEMGISSARTYVKFVNGWMMLTEKEPIKQSQKGNFQFLTEFALKNGCQFRIGTDKAGNNYAIFAQTGDSKAGSLISGLVGGPGTPYQFDYKGGRNNVSSYTWSKQTNNDGGDLVTVHYQNGQPIFKRYAVDRDKVTAYTFHPEKLKKEAQDANAKGGPAAVMSRLSNLLKIKDFQVLLDKGYFTNDSYNSYTPQGLGFEVKVNSIGDTVIAPGVQCYFGGADTAGFPPPITANAENKLTFYIIRVTHKLGMGGYMCSSDTIDSLGILAKRIAL